MKFNGKKELDDFFARAEEQVSYQPKEKKPLLRRKEWVIFSIAALIVLATLTAINIPIYRACMRVFQSSFYCLMQLK